MLGGHSIGHSTQKNVHVYVFYSNGFQDRAISLYSSLYLASNIVLPSHHTAPLSEACESV